MMEEAYELEKPALVSFEHISGRLHTSSRSDGIVKFNEGISTIRLLLSQMSIIFYKVEKKMTIAESNSALPQRRTPLSQVTQSSASSRML